eukprot:4668582-Karenia_brevis.AAC.1
MAESDGTAYWQMADRDGTARWQMADKAGTALWQMAAKFRDSAALAQPQLRRVGTARRQMADMLAPFDDGWPTFGHWL